MNSISSEAKSRYAKIHLNRNGKKYDTANNTTMSGNSNFESSPVMNSTETNKNADPELRALTQAEIDGQIMSFIAPLTKQLENFIWLVHGTTTASHPNYYTKAGISASCNAPGYPPDT